MLELVTYYASHVAVPGPRDINDAEYQRGRLQFHRAGCAACHRPEWRTNPALGLPPQRIWPFTDLLLHDMGEGLADGRPDFAASGREWRTAPLWGLGLTQTVNGHTFLLHDGRARDISEAILWHGGEALVSQEAFLNMSAAEREALLAFLLSL